MDAIQKAVDALAQYHNDTKDQCALMQDTPTEWMLLGTAAAYVALARTLLEFVRDARSSDWQGTDLEQDCIAGIGAVSTNTIEARFRTEADASPVAAYICDDDSSVRAIQERLQR